MTGLRPRGRSCSIFALALLPVVMTGCVPYSQYGDEAVRQNLELHVPSDLGERTYRAVDEMLTDPSGKLLVQTGSVAVVGSVADIADVNLSTPFGNIIADLVRSRLTQRGLPVVDMRLREAIKLDRLEGELTLSRDRREVYPAPATSEIVTGTYAVANGSVYVSLKIIRTADAKIISASDYRLARNADVNRLLQQTIVSR